MPPNALVEPTDEILFDVTKRLELLNRSQTSLYTIDSVQSMPIVKGSPQQGTQDMPELCLNPSASVTPPQSRYQAAAVDKIATRSRVINTINRRQESTTTLVTSRKSDAGLRAELEPRKVGKLEALLRSGKRRMKRSKAKPFAEAQISSYFAGRKSSQRSASSGDSGYESMERPDPLASLMSRRSKEASEMSKTPHTPAAARSYSVAQALPFTDWQDTRVTGVTDSTYFSRRRSDEIKKFKRFSRKLDHKSVFQPLPPTAECDTLDANREETEVIVQSSNREPPANASRHRLSTALHEPLLASAMSSTEDVLGELVSPTSLRSRLQSCRQSNSSLSDGEMSFMGNRAPSLYSVHSPEEGQESLAGQLATRIISRCFPVQDQRAVRSRTASRQGSNQSTPPSSARHTPATSMSNTSKRSRSKDGASEDLDDDDVSRRSPDSKRTKTNGAEEIKLFACPYAKFDPHRFSELNVVEKEYRHCASCYLRDIPRLKQHLYRVHKKPDYYCGSCYDSFKTRELLDVHLRQRPACEVSLPKFEEKMSDDQVNSIKRRIVKGDPYELWFNIFKILFPAAPKPLSPYASANDPIAVNHFVALFRWFGPQEMFNLMQNRRAQAEALPTMEQTTQAVVDEAFEIALPNYLQTRQAGVLPLQIPPSHHVDPVGVMDYGGPRSMGQTMPYYEDAVFHEEEHMATSAPRSAPHHLHQDERRNGTPFDSAFVEAFDSYGTLVQDPVIIHDHTGSLQEEFFAMPLFWHKGMS